MKKPKLKVHEIRLRFGHMKSWLMVERQRVVLSSSIEERKNRFVSRCAKWCRKTATTETPISLRIFRRDGTIIEERTYPRSADPKRSKG